MIPVSEVLTALAPVTVDDQLSGLLESVILENTLALSRDLGRYLGPLRTVAEVYAGGRSWISLRDDPTPNTDITVRTRATSVQPWAEADLVPTTDWAVDERRLTHRSCWPAGISRVQVTYTNGFREGAGPAELRGLVRDMTLATWRRNVAANAGIGDDASVKSETLGDYSYTNFDGGFSLEAVDPASIAGWARIAARWRRLRV